MLESLTGNALDYKRLSPEEMESRGILGRLVGVIADTKNPTRNGRKYSKKLWENVFNDPIMQEKIKNKCVFGELGHPEDRSEIDMEKIAICLSEVPKIDKDGRLQGVFDILNTKNGQILKTLLDYGTNIGVSSRGEGDLYTDSFGEEAVVEDTYDCVGWDAVIIPAVESARPKYVTESLNKTRYRKTLRDKLNESLSSATIDDRKIMLESLNELGIDLGDINDSEKNFNIDETTEDLEGDSITSMAEELQNSLIECKRLEQKIISLNEKLSVCYAKENVYEEDIRRYKNSISKLSEGAKKATSLENKVTTLTEQLNNSEHKIKLLRETIISNNSSRKSLNEDISGKDAEIKYLNESLKKLKADNRKEVEGLNNKLSELQKDFDLTKSKYSSKIDKSNQLVEKYKKITNNVVDKYIESKAIMIGTSKEEVKRRLPESYSIQDIDRVCEDMQDYSLSMNKLPFRSSTIREDIKSVKVNNVNNRTLIPKNTDDEIDNTLLSLAGLK